MNNRQKGILIFLLCFIIAGITFFVGVRTHREREEAAQELEEVHLTMCLVSSKPTDMDMVLEKLNELTLRDLNCTVDIVWIGWGEYASRYSIMLSTNENIDLIYASNWLDFYEHAQRGAFAPLEELLEKYAPKSSEILTDAARKQATVNGHLYALPANYTNYNLLGVIARGDLMDKYDIPAIESFEDYLHFCDVIAEKDGMDPTGMCSMHMDFYTMYVMSMGYYPVTGTTSSPYWIKLGDEDYTVYFQSECPGIEKYLSRAQEWYKKGYWSGNVLVSKDETLLDSGLAASAIQNFDSYLGGYGKNIAMDFRYYNLTEPVVHQTALQDMMAIPALSANKERAMMLLEKLRNDESYYMLLNYGIEGYHYTTNGRQIKFLNDYGNEPGTWGFRDKRYRCWDSVLPEDALKMSAGLEAESVDIPLVNFSLDLGRIQAKYEKIKKVMENYYDPLKLGYIDYESGMEMLSQKLEEAGNEAVKEEIHRQLVEFMDQVDGG